MGRVPRDPPYSNKSLVGLADHRYATVPVDPPYIERLTTTTMNCQDYLYHNVPPQQLARRWFLKECGVGLGAIALGQLAGSKPAQAAVVGGYRRAALMVTRG